MFQVKMVFLHNLNKGELMFLQFAKLFHAQLFVADIDPF